MQMAVRVAVGVLFIVAVVLMVILVLPLLGVPLGFGPFASSAPTASASASASVSEAPSASASTAASTSTEPSASGSAPATPTPPDQGWICGLPVTLAASGPAVVHTSDVSVSAHPEYDRITFTYVEAGAPAFEMRTTRPPFVQDPSGLPMTVAGSSFMRITLNGGTKLADDGTITYTGPTNFQPNYPQLIQLIEQGDFEAVNSWYVGLNGGDCIRASVLANPNRIVIDIQH